jgi:hypothetical protein
VQTTRGGHKSGGGAPHPAATFDRPIRRCRCHRRPPPPTRSSHSVIGRSAAADVRWTAMTTMPPSCHPPGRQREDMVRRTERTRQTTRRSSSRRGGTWEQQAVAVRTGLVAAISPPSPRTCRPRLRDSRAQDLPPPRSAGRWSRGAADRWVPPWAKESRRRRRIVGNSVVGGYVDGRYVVSDSVVGKSVGNMGPGQRRGSMSARPPTAMAMWTSSLS